MMEPPTWHNDTPHSELVELLKEYEPLPTHLLDHWTGLAALGVETTSKRKSTSQCLTPLYATIGSYTTSLHELQRAIHEPMPAMRHISEGDRVRLVMLQLQDIVAELLTMAVEHLQEHIEAGDMFDNSGEIEHPA